MVRRSVSATSQPVVCDLRVESRSSRYSAAPIPSSVSLLDVPPNSLPLAQTIGMACPARPCTALLDHRHSEQPALPVVFYCTTESVFAFPQAESEPRNPLVQVSVSSHPSFPPSRSEFIHSQPGLSQQPLVWFSPRPFRQCRTSARSREISRANFDPAKYTQGNKQRFGQEETAPSLACHGEVILGREKDILIKGEAGVYLPLGKRRTGD